MYIPSLDEFREGYQAFQRRERRDAMYRVATFLVAHFWGKTREMADGLGVLLLTWNQAFYRYGPFDFDRLEECISDNWPSVAAYRDRRILSCSRADDVSIRCLFGDFLTALQIREGKKQGSRSPVAVSKALHLLAPEFFPLWDARIAREYGCYYGNDPQGKYLSYIQKMKRMVEALRAADGVQETGKTMLKLIDEYNYARYTKGWV